MMAMQHDDDDHHSDDLKWSDESSTTNITLPPLLLQQLHRRHPRPTLPITTIFYPNPAAFLAIDAYQPTESVFAAPRHPSSIVSAGGVTSVSVPPPSDGFATPLRIVSKVDSNSSFDWRFWRLPASVEARTGVYKSGDRRYRVVEKCAFWDFAMRRWRDEGCTTSGSSRFSGRVTCACDHMTHFAVILVRLA